MTDAAGCAPAETTRTVTVPTAGLDVQARLGVCDTAEVFVTDLGELDIAARRAEVGTAQERVRRAAQDARRDATPPDLDDLAPTSQLTPLHVVVEQGTSRPTP